jgi:hypothetical protein
VSGGGGGGRRRGGGGGRGSGGGGGGGGGSVGNILDRGQLGDAASMGLGTHRRSSSSSRPFSIGCLAAAGGAWSGVVQVSVGVRHRGGSQRKGITCRLV